QDRAQVRQQVHGLCDLFGKWPKLALRGEEVVIGIDEKKTSPRAIILHIRHAASPLRSKLLRSITCLTPRFTRTAQRDDGSLFDKAGIMGKRSFATVPFSHNTTRSDFIEGFGLLPA